ncbi:MAG: M1 family metallopeptidase [Deltaproteobacteria bacterium]|nr:M1 family metallopeptidase [Deltaproteobacteria bacterium]
MIPRFSSLALIVVVLMACSKTPDPAPPRPPLTPSGPDLTKSTTTSTTTTTTTPAAEVALTRDVHTYARPELARVVHLAVDLTPDFANKTLGGAVRLWIERANPTIDEVILDDRGLIIEAVYDVDGKDLPFTVGKEDPLLGAPLTIKLPVSSLSGKVPARTLVTIKYKSRPDAQALQWLSPAQTASKKKPFLFTQGQAILTRTWIPLQDSPGIRFTYEAQITVPKGMRAVMSAEPTQAAEGRVVTLAGEPEKLVFTFEMPQRIPAYLIALGVGDLAFQPLGPRTGVYADPTVLAAAAHEFADTEKMVEAAEGLYGPYRWGRYDILVLPPSFPFGGMENPRLTFASPTAIAGDRSLVSLIAHELAHSWSGNLVTNATWSDVWLNEGTTVYFEDRIVEKIYGVDSAHMNQVLGWQDLEREIAEFGKDSPRSKLWRPLDGEDPDDSITGVPYIKGSAFLRSIEGVVGRARFDAFLKAYFEANKFQSMSTARFLELIKRDLASSDAERTAMRLELWAYETGIPEGFSPPSSKLLQKVNADVVRISNGEALSAVDVSAYSALQWVHLIKNLPRARTAEQMKALDDAWAFNKSGNSEVLFEWLRLVIANHDTPSLPVLERYLTKQGRRRLVLPLYEDLVKSEWGSAFALRVFAAAKPTYHPLTATSVEALFPMALK